MKAAKVKPRSSAPSPVSLDISLLSPRPGNRNLSDDPHVAELAESLRVIGQLHAVHVRTLPDGGYEILAGVRRWTALQLNKASQILAVVHDGMDDTAADELRLHENTHRREPSALDLARELQRIKNVKAYTHEQVASHCALSLNRVKLYLSVFTASDALLAAIEKHALPISMAVALKKYEAEAGVPALRSALKGVVAHDYTVRDVETMRKRGRKEARVSASAPRTPADPWKRVTSRIRNLGKKNPQAAVAQLQALLAELSSAASTASGVEVS